MAHNCSTALIKCMDFRLTGSVCSWMQAQNLVDDCDVISVAGAAKDLVDNPEGFVFTQVQLSIKLHQTKQIAILYHMDCGAYGGSKAFANQDEELVRYKKDMLRAKEIIAKSFPQVAVELFMAYQVKDGWEIKVLK